MPNVIVRFYYNFGKEDTSNVGVAKFGEPQFDFGREQYFMLITFRVTASAGSYRLFIFNKGDVLEPASENETAPIAWDASSSAVAAALQAVGSVGGSHTFEFDGFEDVELEPDEHFRVVKAWAVMLSGTHLFPDGYNTDSSDLSGHIIDTHDEHVFHVPLTEAELAQAKSKQSQIEPTDASSSPKKTRNRKSNQRLSTANVQGGDGSDPFPDSPNDSSPT